MLAPRHASRPWRKTPAVFIVVASLQTAGAHRATEMFQRLLQLRSPRGRARYATLFMRRFAPNRPRRCCSLNRFAMRPDKIHGEAKKNQAEYERDGRQQRIRGTQEFGLLFAAAMKNKSARSEQREEEPFRIDHASEERAVGVGHRKRGGPYGLCSDSKMRRAAHRMKRGHPAESQTVLRHGVVDARPGERDP